MNLTLFMQVLPKAGLGWLGVFAVTIIIVAGILLCVGNTGCGIRGKGDFFIRPVAAHGMEQANQPFLHRIVKVKAGCCNGSGAFAYGRHHGGDQRGNSAFLPSLCLPYAKAPLPLQHPALTLTMRCRKG